ncbi:MAG: ABC transporter permease [Flavobacteriales bacterium]|jgi:lipoprotein-releasing system permease protein
MNLSRFIAQRMVKSSDKSQMSQPIVRIATAGIAIGVALMIIALAVVRGFQDEVRKKVIGFGSHFQVVANEDNYSKESIKLQLDTAVYADLTKVPGVKHVQVFASKPGIVESKEALQGVVIKGVGEDYDWSFIQSNMVEGQVLSTSTHRDSMPAKEVVISSYLAKRMQVKLGGKLSVYFVNSQADARQQNFVVKGIYNTGLEDYDKQYVFLDIAYVQKYSSWGLQAQLVVDTACFGGAIAYGANAFGGDGDYVYQWSDSTLRGQGPFFIQCNKDTTLTVVIKDGSGTVADTAFATINFIDDQSVEACRPYEIVYRTKRGSERNYIGGYEVLINDYNQLMAMDDEIYKTVPFYLYTSKITERSPEMFSWLSMLDINVKVIIILMICISIVNMTSALLIIILERQRMIGTLKAFGIRDGSVLRIFLYNAAYIIGKGVIWGNVVGIGLCLLQHYTGAISLDPTNYYLDTVPVKMEWLFILALNLGTMLTCVGALVFPAFYVTTISPIAAIRKD